MSIKSLAHVCLNSTDLDATADFYCGALGLTRMFDFTRKGKVIGFYLSAGNTTFVEVFLQGETAPIERNRHHLSHLCLETGDLKALHASLVERGLKPGPVTLGSDHSPQFWMEDPSGMALEFQEYTAESSQLTGRAVEVNW